MSSQPKELMELLFPVTLATGVPFMSTSVGGVGGGDTGSNVGLLVGGFEADLLGAFVGSDVGTEVGLTEGDLLGSCVGSDVGGGVGLFDGCI